MTSLPPQQSMATLSCQPADAGSSLANQHSPWRVERRIRPGCAGGTCMGASGSNPLQNCVPGATAPWHPPHDAPGYGHVLLHQRPLFVFICFPTFTYFMMSEANPFLLLPSKASLSSCPDSKVGEEAEMCDIIEAYLPFVPRGLTIQI